MDDYDSRTDGGEPHRAGRQGGPAKGGWYPFEKVQRSRRNEGAASADREFGRSI